MAEFNEKREWKFDITYLELALDMPPDVWGQLSKAVITYALKGEIIAVPRELAYVFKMMCNDIDHKRKSYVESVTNGKKGGRPSKDNKTPKNPLKPPKSVTSKQASENVSKQVCQYVSNDSMTACLDDTGNGPSADAGPKPAFAGKVVHHP